MILFTSLETPKIHVELEDTLNNQNTMDNQYNPEKNEQSWRHHKAT